jgi:hypothetical protein
VVIFLTTSSLLGPADRCYLSSKPSELGACYFAVTAGAVSISTAVLAGCLTVRSKVWHRLYMELEVAHSDNSRHLHDSALRAMFGCTKRVCHLAHGWTLLHS